MTPARPPFAGGLRATGVPSSFSSVRARTKLPAAWGPRRSAASGRLATQATARPTSAAAMRGSGRTRPSACGTPAAMAWVMSVAALPTSLCQQAMPAGRPASESDSVRPVTALRWPCRPSTSAGAPVRRRTRRRSSGRPCGDCVRKTRNASRLRSNTPVRGPRPRTTARARPRRAPAPGRTTSAEAVQRRQRMERRRRRRRCRSSAGADAARTPGQQPPRQPCRTTTDTCSATRPAGVRSDADRPSYSQAKTS